MGAVAVFDVDKWQTRYPEFANVDPDLAQAYFAEACIYFRNDGTGLCSDSAMQLIILNMLTAHIAARYSNPDGSAQDSNSPVGRLSGASEGSVSAQFDMGTVPGTQAWFMQTRYGADFWAATAQYRTMRYRVAFPRAVDPWRPWTAFRL